MDGGVIAINWSGVFIIDKNEKHILDISFMEITGCSGKSIPKSTVLKRHYAEIILKLSESKYGRRPVQFCHNNCQRKRFSI